MISLRYFFLFASVAVAFGWDNKLGNSQTEVRTLIHQFNLNDVFDGSLPYIRHYLTGHGFDPMDVQDMDIELSPLPSVFEAKLHLHHGHMQQFSTIYRAGDILMQLYKDKVSFYLNIGFETIDLSHEYFLKYLMFERKGDCYGRYHMVEATMEFDFEFASKTIDLKHFKFTKVGDFKLKLEGHASDKIINFITKIATKLFRTKVLKMIEARAYIEIDKAIADFNNGGPSREELGMIFMEVMKRFESKNIALDRSDNLTPM